MARVVHPKALSSPYRWLQNSHRSLVRRCTAASFHTSSVDEKKKAVIFDMGGVILPSPFGATMRWEAKQKFPKDTLSKAIKHSIQSNGAWCQLERGEITMEQFYTAFAEDAGKDSPMSIPQNVENYMKMLHDALSEIDADIIEAVNMLKENDIKTAILTNNWHYWHTVGIFETLGEHFDEVIESWKVGMRKPDPRIYHLALEKLNVSPHEAVFLDDIGGNLSTAKEVGIETIKVDDVGSALVDLQKIMDLDLGYVPGTSKVRKGMELDEDKLQKYLVDLGIEEDKLKVRQFRHGQSNPTYLLQQGGRQLVLRKKPPGKLLPGAHAIEREYKVMDALGKNGVPMPKLISLCEDECIVGTPFYLMEYVKGKIYKDPKLPGLSPEDRKKVYGAMNKVLSKIHSVDVHKAGIADYGKHGGYIERTVKTWTRQYEASKTEEIESMNKLMEWLPKNAPQQTGTSVVHGDFRVDNLIYDENDPENVLAVLDWELSTLGDPLADAAYPCMTHYIPHEAKMLGGLKGLDLNTMGIPTEKEWLEEYCKNRGIQNSDDFYYYMSFGFFRMAAILQGVYKRSLKNQASGENAQQAGMMAKGFADVSWSLAQKHDHIKSSKQEQKASIGTLAVTVDALRPEVQKIHKEVKEFVNELVIPLEKVLRDHSEAETWNPHPKVDELKEKAKAAGLWNLFLPIEADPEMKFGRGLTNLEYAHIAEIMGQSLFAPEMFNCNAPDTGNMEVFVKYGTEEQKEKWLKPLLDGKIRSCFSMTEPAVASSDATNVQSSIVRDGDEYVLNGRKWWSTGAMDSRTKVCIFMGKTDPTAAKHQQQSMVVVPFDAPGVTVMRPLSVFGGKDSPSGHAEVDFSNVRVPVSNILLGEGRGFEIAQGRLGPGRIHHCMRLIGCAERGLQLMNERVHRRTAFGKPLASQGTIQQDIAMSRIEIEQSRLLTLKAAHMMDTVGNKVSAPEIAMIKVVAPNMAMKVLDRSMQAHGAAGVHSDLPLAEMFAYARTMRLADGPDEVHVRAISRFEMAKNVR